MKFPAGSWRVRGWVLATPGDFPTWSDQDHVVDMAQSASGAILSFRAYARTVLVADQTLVYSVQRIGPGENHPGGVFP